MKLALVLHHERSEAIAIARKLIDLASETDLEVVAGERDAPRLSLDSVDLDLAGIEAVVAIGGDGTVLEGARLGLTHDVPVLGLNAGRVGFLAEEPEVLESAVDALASGRWNESRIMTVEAAAGDRSATGINDVVIEKVSSQRLVSISLTADDHPVLTYHADGVIVCTPTGSTAYNLSAGGPVVDRRLEGLIVTPVASHSLFARPLVFAPHAILRFEVLHDRAVGINVDGRELARLEPGAVVEVRRGEKSARFLDLTGRTFDQIIRRKFRLS